MNSHSTLKSLKICTLMGSFWTKYIAFELKKYREVMCHYTEKRWRLWKKNDLWFYKWHEGFGELHQSTQNSENLHFQRLFCPKCIMFELKKGSCVMTLKGDIIFKEKLTGGLKYDTRNLINFHASSQKSRNFHYHGLFLSTAYKLSGKKVHESRLSWHWRVIQTLKKNWLFVWKMTRGTWWILTQVK